MPVSIGEMRDEVTVQRRVLTANTYGERVPTWIAVRTVRANVVPVAGAKQFGAAADADYHVTLRYFTYRDPDGTGGTIKLNPEHRLVIDGTSYQVRSAINPDGKRRFHELACIAIVTQGGN